MAARRQRVLFAIPSLDHGGPDRVLYELLVGLDRERFAPTLLVTEPHGYYLERLPSDIGIEVLQPRFLRRYPVVPALRYIRSTKPDVVFATLRMVLTLGLVSAAFPRRTKLVLRQANDLTADFALLVQRSVIKHRFARWLSIAALNRADAVVCQSEAMRRDLAHLLGEEQRLLVISNPVDAGRVEHATRARAPKLAGFPSIVSVGRLVPQKGYDVLLHAVAKLRAEHPRMHLTILGEGSERTQLEALIRELAIEDMVTLAGFVAEPLPYVRGADLFALSSRYEGFPNAALEALACGTPVVLTDCPGANSELVRPGRNGELAAAVDPAVFAGALMRAVNNLGTYDRAWISSDCFERYSSARIVREYERVFSA